MLIRVSYSKAPQQCPVALHDQDSDMWQSLGTTSPDGGLSGEILDNTLSQLDFLNIYVQPFVVYID